MGYSGENDPVFSHLAEIQRFDNGLFWIGYQDSEPAAHVRDHLVGQDKDAFFTKGFDADSFFVRLTRELNVFPPDLVARPFTYLERALASIAPFVEPGSTGSVSEDDVMTTPRVWIKNAITQFELPAWEIITGGASSDLRGQDRATLHAVAARYLLMAGRHEDVLNFRKEFDASPSPALADVLSLAYVLRGNALLDRAKATSDAEQSDHFFADAQSNYESAIAVKPDRSGGASQLGEPAVGSGKAHDRRGRRPIVQCGGSEVRAGLGIDPRRHDVLVNWGSVVGQSKVQRECGDRQEYFSAAQDNIPGRLESRAGPAVGVDQLGQPAARSR